jgi:predicted MPP superfamily phosphohydrolase
MRNRNYWWLIVTALLLLDWYVFTVIRFLCAHLGERTRTIVYVVYWVVSIGALVLLTLLPSITYFDRHVHARGFVFTAIAGLLIAKLFAALFFLFDDIRRGILFLIQKLFPSDSTRPAEAEGISRSAFLSWAGVGVGSALFGTLLYGITNRYNYQLKKVRLAFPNLPESFNGLKIVQISDIHSGSFNNVEAVAHGVQMILDQKPDLILFTGDLVNNLASEMQDYIAVFSRLQAPLGVYSILGNHDYADYVKEWPTRTAKAENLAALKATHGKMGWRLLLNENLPLERNGEQIGLLGIENWSASRAFSRYGDMEKTYAGADKYPFKILMSHDPTHWDAMVRPEYPDIDLTLSGHTHGAQFGIENPWFRWSPVQWVYRQWAGLYEEGKQKIYVNRGYGFIGYPGRVGILPEITVLELFNK